MKRIQLGVLVIALGAAGWLIGLPLPARNPPAAAPAPAPANPTLTAAWPTARVVTTPAVGYSPQQYHGADLSVGVVRTADGGADLLVIRGADGTERELRRVPVAQYPQFLGFTSAGDDLYWVEVSISDERASRTRIWRGSWTGARPAVPLTADTGASVFFNSQYDLVVADGRVHWIAAAPTDALNTELRSVPVGGGAVTMSVFPGAFGLSAWPWLISQGDGTPDAPLRLLNSVTGQESVIPTSPTELVGCSPVWCRAIVVNAAGGAARFDLMRPDGSERHRVAGSNASAAVADVALLDRFEVLALRGPATQALELYDLRDRRLVEIDPAVGTVLARDGVLWWSTGDQDAPAEWHALDLRTLP